MGNEAITVSEFNSLLNQTLSFAYPEVIVEGEVSSFKVNQGKWVFFDLKDEDSLVGCFITIYQLKTELEDGMLIRVKATPQLTKWGKFSLTVKEVELAGEGSVKRAFEMLKAKFEKEGLFEQDRKRQLPQYPQKIALITSNQAAAYNDFLTIINDRWAGLEIEHIQVQVQGPSAPLQIAEAIGYINELKGYDALVIIRGGGSAEDLQAFNTEEVVRAVYGSRVPTLVAIGHEDDVSLAELAADIRGATPTDAARRLVPDKLELISKIKSDQLRNYSAIESILLKTRQHLNGFYHSL
jgi:exodeoxyribonuclease VII large subunit